MVGVARGVMAQCARVRAGSRLKSEFPPLLPAQPVVDTDHALDAAGNLRGAIRRLWRPYYSAKKNGAVIGVDLDRMSSAHAVVGQCALDFDYDQIILSALGRRCVVMLGRGGCLLLPQGSSN
jgi:hypothetical protein